MKTIITNSITVLFASLAICFATSLGAAGVSPLVSTEWVADNLKGITLIDVSKKGYAQGHIPGAVHLKWGSEVFAPETDHMVLGLAEIERVMGSKGVTPHDHVVLYDGDEKKPHHVTRVYWTMKYWNFPKVSIMDGGIYKWKQEKRPVTTEATKPSRIRAEVAYPPNTRIRAMYSPHITHALATGKSVILDSRPKAYFDGEKYSLKKWVRSGHITGSVNLAALGAANKDTTYKPVEELKAMHEKAGLTADKSIITYCDTGVLGTHSWFVMSELLGYKNVSVYDGSIREFGNWFDTPMQPGVVGGEFPKGPIQELQGKVK